MTGFIATRAGGLAEMDRFISGMGRQYEERRNDGNGPGARTDVSMLSPCLCLRLITEREVIAAAIDAHSTDGASEFIEEVI